MNFELPLTFSGRRAAAVILQTEAAECGLACLAMVAAHHGHRSDLATLRSRYPISLKGATLAHLVNIAHRLDLAARALKVELSELDRLALPAVLHWDLSHFVVLVDVRGRKAVIHDPARGRCVLSLDEVSRHFTGVALELVPTQEFRPKVEIQRVGLSRLIGRLPGAGGALGQILALAAVLEVFGIVAPFFMQLVVDHALVGEDRDLLAVLGVGFLLLALVHVGICALRSWAVMVLSTTLNLALVARLFRKLLALPVSFFERRHLGDIVSRFDSLSVIQRTLTTGFLEALVDGVMAIVTLAVMVWYSNALALIVLGAAAAYAVVRFALYRPLRRACEDHIVRLARQQSNFLETVRGVQSIKLFNRQQQRSALYQNLLVDQFNAGVRVQRLQMLYRALNGVLFGVENVAVVWLGALAVIDGGFSVGMLFAFVSYKQQFIARVGTLVEKAIEFRMLGLHTERVADVALAGAERDTGGTIDQTGHAAIELRRVSFRYSDLDPPVLHDVSLRIEAGESVAITGPSGCGKTTLARILLGLLEPSGGEVLIGGVSLQRLALSSHREQVGAVMQEDQLFAGSIGDNIAFFDPAPDVARIERCARLAAVHDEVAAMPMGYNTLVGDMGTVLSGGQKQRVLLARALYREPRILVLDEATSHLDVTREREVNHAIQQLKLTRIIIAHRPETIASCDRVLVLGLGAPLPREAQEMMGDVPSSDLPKAPAVRSPISALEIARRGRMAQHLRRDECVG
jgi:ATP-binding cassette subfamily B protein RaxB